MREPDRLHCPYREEMGFWETVRVFVCFFIIYCPNFLWRLCVTIMGKQNEVKYGKKKWWLTQDRRGWQGGKGRPCRAPPGSRAVGLASQDRKCRPQGRPWMVSSEVVVSSGGQENCGPNRTPSPISPSSPQPLPAVTTNLSPVSMSSVFLDST